MTFGRLVKLRGSITSATWRRHIRAKRVPYITEKEQQAGSCDAERANVNLSGECTRQSGRTMEFTRTNERLPIDRKIAIVRDTGRTVFFFFTGPVHVPICLPWP